MRIRTSFLVLLFAIQSACTPDRSARLRSIGDYFAQQSIAGTVTSLADSRSVPDVVHVGSSLPVALAAMRPGLQDGYTVKSQPGDAFGEGGGVTHSIIIRTAHNAICLRVRYDSGLDRFHIVGYCAVQPKQRQTQ